MLGKYVETPVVSNKILILPLQIGEASMNIMSSTRGKHRLPTLLYTESKVVSYRIIGVSTVSLCSPALLYSYDIINDVFVQIWKHSCKCPGGILISKTLDIHFEIILTRQHPGARLAVSAKLPRIQRSLDVQPPPLH